MVNLVLQKLFGTYHERERKRLWPLVERIHSLQLLMRCLMPCVVLVLVTSCATPELRRLVKGRRLQITAKEQALLDRLEGDASFARVACASGPRRPHEEILLAEQNAVRLALTQAASSAVGVVRAKRTCMTDEGDPVTEYLVVDAGKIHFVYDGSRDQFGDGHVSSYEVGGLELGYLGDEGMFHRLEPETAVHTDRILIIGYWPLGSKERLLYF